MARLFRIPMPPPPSPLVLHTAGVYSSGALFALGLFVFLDASVFSRVANGTSHVHVSFVDWIPLICSVLGMLVISSIEKAGLNTDSYNPGVAWKARLVLFMGFALIAGGLAGSVTVLVLKYVVPGYPWPTMWFGVANAVANGLVMLSCCTLWVAQYVHDDNYTYDLRL